MIWRLRPPQNPDESQYMYAGDAMGEFNPALLEWREAGSEPPTAEEMEAEWATYQMELTAKSVDEIFTEPSRMNAADYLNYGVE